MPRLLEQVREAVRTCHQSIRAEEAYIRWTREYILFCGKRHPAELGAREGSAFISHLAVGRKVAASRSTCATARAAEVLGVRSTMNECVVAAWPRAISTLSLYREFKF